MIVIMRIVHKPLYLARRTGSDERHVDTNLHSSLPGDSFLAFQRQMGHLANRLIMFSMVMNFVFHFRSVLPSVFPLPVVAWTYC